ncbi:MAG: nucleotide sugar dehydrogenase, partial [Gammaproteobacteria bacterium]|nr:nucleotide sugar dehydrogenase [Gammaproteobacteria bacterium]
MNHSRHKVAVIGLGYVGLPLAALCARQGYRVVGFDMNQKIVDLLAAGKCHFRDETVETSLTAANASGNLSVTTDAADIADCAIYLICVPTPVDANNDPDLEPLQSACRVVAPLLAKDDLVVVESTVFPGTCEQIVVPMLEEISGLDSARDLLVAHCPERVNPGDLFWTSENIPRVVGATSARGVDLAAEFYASILGGDIFDVRDVRASLSPKFRDTEYGVHVAQVPRGSVTKMHSIRDAEAVKAMENTVRDVNIAFVNELAKISDVLELDVVDIIDGMATKPFGKGPFYP